MHWCTTKDFSFRYVNGEIHYLESNGCCLDCMLKIKQGVGYDGAVNIIDQVCNKFVVKLLPLDGK